MTAKEEALAEELTALWRKCEQRDMKQVCTRIEKIPTERRMTERYTEEGGEVMVLAW